MSEQVPADLPREPKRPLPRVTRRLSELVDASTPETLPPFAAVERNRVRRRTRRRGIAASVTAVVLVAGTVAAGAMLTGPRQGNDRAVIEPSADSHTEVTSPSTPGGSAIADQPPEWDEGKAPPVVLQLDGRTTRLEPWGWCYTSPKGHGSCVDGAPRQPFADVGLRNSVPFAFPLEGWTFRATFTPLSESVCERSITLDVTKTGRYTFEVPLAGPPDDYQVNLFGRGPQGDVITTFSWATTAMGTIPAPTGYLGIVGGDPEELHFYGPELGLQDIADLSERPSAIITATASNGESLTMPRLRADRACFGSGHAWFRGPDAWSAALGELGPPPYRYDVDLVLDRTHYRGTGVWPRDEQFENEPYVTLEFTPPLPGYSG